MELRMPIDRGLILITLVIACHLLACAQAGQSSGPAAVTATSGMQAVVGLAPAGQTSTPSVDPPQAVPAPVSSNAAPSQPAPTAPAGVPATPSDGPTPRT